MDIEKEKAIAYEDGFNAGLEFYERKQKEFDSRCGCKCFRCWFCGEQVNDHMNYCCNCGKEVKKRGLI